MKKVYLFLILFTLFIGKAEASEYFYLGEKIPNFYIYMDRGDKIVNYNLKGVYRSINNELVYCIQPGVVLSSNSYDEYDEYSNIFNISEEKFNRIKLIAYYGYNYKDHTDIKWYLITQYLIWKEIKPDNWVMYLSDVSKNNIDYIYQNEIDEIYNLVNNHNNTLGIEKGYVINYRRDFTISATDDLSNYISNIGYINNNQLIINNLDYGKNDISISSSNYNKTVFYYNENGQNVFKRGDAYERNIKTYIYVTAGKIKINECNEETFEKDFIGGTYEILNSDDAVLGEITCEDSDCISNYLPIGFHKIRVKNLSDSYEMNEHIYDVEVKDNEMSEINICSLKKKELKRTIIKDEEPEEETNDVVDDEPYEYSSVEIVEEDNYEQVDVPYTHKDSYLKFVIIIMILISYLFIEIKHENNI